MSRILYVDDEADIREVAQMALEIDPQFEVRTCASGADGIEQGRPLRSLPFPVHKTVGFHEFFFCVRRTCRTRT